MPRWYMFVRADNSTMGDHFKNAAHLARVLTPIEFDFALLEDKPAIIHAWAESRWGFPIGPWVRVWEIEAVVGGKQHWIPSIMDMWARK